LERVIWQPVSLANSLRFTVPYGDMSNSETAQYILSGHRLAKPPKCPDEVYEVMLSCWKEKPEDRPTFKDLYASFSALLAKVTTSTPDSKLQEPQNSVSFYHMTADTNLADDSKPTKEVFGENYN
jgi:hypothetical protein